MVFRHAFSQSDPENKQKRKLRGNGRRETDKQHQQRGAVKKVNKNKRRSFDENSVPRHVPF